MGGCQSTKQLEKLIESMEETYVKVEQTLQCKNEEIRNLHSICLFFVIDMATCTFLSFPNTVEGVYKMYVSFSKEELDKWFVLDTTETIVIKGKEQQAYVHRDHLEAPHFIRLELCNVCFMYRQVVRNEDGSWSVTMLSASNEPFGYTLL
jgi:hypothetical protein